MVRALSRRLLVVSFAALMAAHAAAAALGDATDAPPVLQRFLALADPTPSSSRVLRHLEAENEKFNLKAWMDVWTETDASGFRYHIVAEDGSERIRMKVFRESLETERRMWASGEPDGASVSPANYTFADRGAIADGLAALDIKPRRKDVLLVDGSIFLRPGDGELLRIEGDLAKPPSFWTRHVRIVRHFERVAGFRMPVSLEAVANLRFFGTSTFRAVYEYETVNAERVGTPQLRAASR